MRLPRLRIPGFLAITLLAPALLAGCFGDDDEPPRPGDDDVVPGDPVNALFAASGCREAAAILLVDFPQAREHLPPGYEARDAQSLVRRSDPTGQAAVLLTSATCDSMQQAWSNVSYGRIAVYVDAPDVEGEREESDLHFYEVAHFTAHAELASLLRSASWRVEAGEPHLAIGPSPYGFLVASGGVRAAEENHYTFNLTLPISDSLEGVARFWHDTPGGTAHVDLRLGVTAYGGTAVCTLREGSLAHDVAGTTRCVGGRAYGLAFPDFAFEGRVVHEPGVKPRA